VTVRNAELGVRSEQGGTRSTRCARSGQAPGRTSADYADYAGEGKALRACRGGGQKVECSLSPLFPATRPFFEPRRGGLLCSHGRKPVECDPTTIFFFLIEPHRGD